MRRPCFSAADTDGDAVPGTPLSARATLAGGVQPTAPAVAADVCVTSAASPAETITPAALSRRCRRDPRRLCRRV